MDFPGDSAVKYLPAKVGDAGSVPESGKSPGEGNGNQVQYSCLGNPMDRGTWWATIHGVTESDMTEQLTFSLFTGLPWWLSGKRIHLPMQKTRI